MRVPSDKSITQRAVLLGGTARGTTRIRAPLDSADARSVLGVVQRLGASLTETDGCWVLKGTGAGGVEPSPGELDFGNSGTGARLGLGLLCGLGVEATLCGDASLSRRPMGRVLDPLRQMGARLPGTTTLPVHLPGPQKLRPFRGTPAVASAQVKSAILLAALRAQGQTRLREISATRDHTERMLPAFGVPVECVDGEIRLRGPVDWSGCEITVPADPSSVAPLAAAVACLPGSSVEFPEVLDSARRCAFFEVLAAMGAQVEWADRRRCGGEDVGTLRVVAGELRGVEVPPERVGDMIDELPLVAVLGALAEGQTRVRGAAELRVKESDRIATMHEGLKALGAHFVEVEDGFDIQGRSRLDGGRVHSHDDHRVAMALSVASLRCEGVVVLTGAEAVGVSFPAFHAELSRLLMGTWTCQPADPT